MSARILALLASLLITAAPLPAPRSAVVADIPVAPMGWVSRTPDDGWTGAPSVASGAPSTSLSAAGKRPGSEAQPTAKPSAASLRGVASWFDAAPTLAAAGPALREALGPDWRGTWVRVCAGSCVRVQLLDWCLCRVGDSERLIDLSRSAFGRLADPSRGLVRVMVEVVRG